MRSAISGLVGLLCVLAIAPGCHGCGKPPPIPLDGPADAGAVVFPLPDDGWTERAPLAGATSPREVTLSAPKIDDKGYLEVNGKAFSLSFSDALFDDAKSAPALTITPNVAGRTTWTSPYTVEFLADQPFDPAVEYAVSLPAATTPRGKKFPSFSAKFKPNPEITIAGKIIHYVPAPGKPRAIYVRPIDDRDVGPNQQFVAIYDQPIELAAAKKLISLKDAKSGAVIPLTLSHAPAGGTFEGEKVDSNDVVLFKMAAAPGFDRDLELSVANVDPAVEPQTRKLHAVALPKLARIDCDDPTACKHEGGNIRGNVSTTLQVQVTNRVHDEDVEGHVKITPTPSKVSVGAYDTTVYIHANWDPAKTYQISWNGIKDKFGYKIPDSSLTFTTAARAAHAILREGVMVLDEAGAKDMYVTTRNVKRGELHVWQIPPGAMDRALDSTHANSAPTGFGDPKTFLFDGTGEPHVYGKTNLDLWSRLEPGHSYLAMVDVKDPSNGAEPMAVSQPSVPLFMIAGKDSVGAHVHTVGSKSLVSAYRLATGEPASGVGVGVDSAKSITDDKGIAILDTPAKGVHGVTLKSGSEETIVPFDRIAQSANDFYPDLTSRLDSPEGDEPAAHGELMGVLITDRGIYKPGTKINVKGHVRRADQERISGVAQQKVRLRVIDSSGADIVDQKLTTSAKGAIEQTVPIPSAQQGGPTRIRLEVDDDKHSLLAEETIRISDFEIPRFKVDIEAPSAVDGDHWKPRVIGKYSFGAAMDAGMVEWSIRQREKTVESHALEAQGFTFGRERDDFDSFGPKVAAPPTRTGEGKLGLDGTFDVDVDLGAAGASPTEVTFEADVSDSSYRHISNRKTIMRYPFTRYAGIRLPQRFGQYGPMKVDLVAVDKEGKPVAGAPLEARLERLEWKKSSEKAESGATVESWGATATAMGSCTVTSAATPQTCTLTTVKRGEYRVVARIDGHDQASTFFYAWGGEDSEGPYATPSNGKKTPIGTDRKAYAPGDTAHVLVQSPFPEAIAVLTVERGGLLSHDTKRFKGPSVVMDVPLTLAHAPYSYAVVTLLPIGAGPEATYRLGAVKLPVALDGARLAVSVASARAQYDARETADITVEVKRNGAPVKNADVTLAVVDEGVLRLTDFHAKDPTSALHPARPLAFGVADSRQLLFRRHEKAHVAGGGGEGPDSLDARREFVETAAWLPSLTTDSNGRVTTSVKLPDNLTEFRMMATVLGEDGAAGAAENSFVVVRPYLLDPIVPTFATRGDKLEIAAMAHNNTDRATNAQVMILGQKRDIHLEPHSHQRVGIPFVAEKDVDVTFSLDVDGKAKDRVEKHIHIDLPGTEEHPQRSGVFRERQEITFAVPEDAIFEDDAKLILKTGSALYPELGQRLSFLRDYPHGCVEQTTSGTLPFLAARNLLPWSGAIGLSDEELKKRITAGVKRLATMKVPGGGLAYWPGGTEPNVFGTTYALRALLRAKAIGIEEEGLVDSTVAFLVQQLPRERKPIVRIAIAEVLAQATKLDASAADGLFDDHDKLDAFGTASLALALASLPKQEERTKTLLDQLEAMFDAEGITKTNPHGETDWQYWSSPDRDRAESLLALQKLRPTSKLATTLAQRLIRGIDGYTTQSTAWSLMALSTFVGDGAPNGAVNVKIKAEGAIFDTTRRLGGDNKEVAFPMKDLRGKKVKLVLEGDAQTPSAYSLEARFVRPDATSSRTARHSPLGPSVYRVFTTPTGAPVDLAQIKAGDVVRVAIRIDLPKLDSWRANYLAVTDRFAAGFSPIQPDLATVASPPGLTKAHPWYDELTGWGGSASHVDVREDRVNLYFDRVYSGHTAFATYLLRATTPGEFRLPAARGELMYEPGSEGYSEGGQVFIR